MKKLILGMALTLFTVAFVHAQEEDVLIKLPKLKSVGFYLTPEYQFGQVNQMTNSFTGWSAGVTLNKRLSVGFTRIGLFNPSAALTNSANPVSYNANFGGVKIEYTFFPKSPVHLVVPLTIGTGGYTESVSSNPRRGPRNLNNLFVAIPGVVAEANVFKFLKVYAGATYRYSAAFSSTTSAGEALKGFVFTSGFRFGLFGKKVGK